VNPQTDPVAACAALHEAAQLLREDPNRRGSLLTFGSAGQLVMTGDIHGHVRNFERLQRFCDLAHSPARSVILHELIHAEPESFNEPDLSIDLVVEAARWKCDFPDNVFILQSNHELSQLCRHEITKGGRSVIRDFERGVAHRFGRRSDDVLEALDDYLGSLPLAARTASGIFLSHSLPDPLSLSLFDFNVFDRVPTEQDLETGGAAYSLVWGRFHSPEVLDLLAQRLGAEIFIVGHTPQESGYGVVGRMILLASDHAHGSFLPIDLARAYTVAELERLIRKFVEVP
jgi:hypothetical protein